MLLVLYYYPVGFIFNPKVFPLICLRSLISTTTRVTRVRQVRFSTWQCYPNCTQFRRSTWELL